MRNEWVNGRMGEAAKSSNSVSLRAYVDQQGFFPRLEFEPVF
jgi:hypothetical protein